MKTTVRAAAVAGRFYPADRAELRAEIAEYARGDPVPGTVTRGATKAPARGCVVPHAGYMFSGHVAGAVYGSLDIPSRCILLGPRHFPRGAPMAILTEGSWATPLGEAEVDAELARAMAHECPMLREDAVAHEREHSLEVQLPFLQELAPGFRFVPIVLVSDRFGALEELGRAVARVVKAARDRVMVVASTDLNHYEDDAITRVKDARAVEKIVALDARGLFDTVRNEGISMCGYAATVAMIVTMRELGATEAKLVRYATSGDVNGIRDEVVGYAGIVVN